MLAQILFLAAAAHWFLIQAVAHPEFKRLCAGGNGRVKCLYHSLTMAGAALMVAMMGHVTDAATGTVPAHGTSMCVSMPMGHHTMAMHSSGTSAGTSGHQFDLALPMTVLFGAAAAVFVFLLLRSRTAKTIRREKATGRLSLGAGHAVEALGAAVMAIMFAAMA
jgi:hypothetical protein